MKKLLLAGVLMSSASSPAFTQWVDWDRITHWAGEGENKAALVIDFKDGKGDMAYVWGYRWTGTASGEDMLRAIASQSSALTVLVQYTGAMGSTLNGVGLSANREHLDYLRYDYEGALNGSSFDFNNPNTSMGQDSAPGASAEQMCIDAIEDSRTSGIIEHPLNAFVYGYPSYDYDYWQLEEGYEEAWEYRWRAGWYEGYWSYWCGDSDYDSMSYSGLGMSSAMLTDGCVQAWKYVDFGYTGGGIGDTGDELSEELDYDIMDYNEEMHVPVTVAQPVDHSKIAMWVGSGEKSASVVLEFKDGKNPSNIVYGYRWSGGWDDNLGTVLDNIAKADSRLTVDRSNGLKISFDTNGDGTISATEHDGSDGAWSGYVKRVVDKSLNKVPLDRFLNPNAVMLVSDTKTTAALPRTLMYSPVTDIQLDVADSDGVITLTPKEMAGIMPRLSPEAPTNSNYTVTLKDNGSSKADYIATAYKVNLWDENNKRMQPYELSGHREGECTLTIASTDGFCSRDFTVKVVDREREQAIDYNTGTIMLNEEWFGHTNGGLNWFSPDYEVTYQAYERENPGMSFGCTSQYAIIYGGKLIVSSKQAADNGDPLPGGGRLVVADASTLRRLGSIDDIMVEGETRSADGRALCGAGPGRVYMGTSSGIYIIDIDNCSITGKIEGSDPEGNAADLYNGQIGDMVLAGKHAFALRQSTGVYIIDIDTDEIVKAIADANVQGITQAYDGTVWYATVNADKQSEFVALDHLTLEEKERVTVPKDCGTVTCGWGAWRTTQFTAAQTVPSLFFAGGSSISNGGSGIIWRYDIEDGTFTQLAQVSGLPAHTPGLKQGAYGTIRYDDRSGEIIAGTTESKASGHYRYNWTHFIDAASGEILRTIELRPYYWFQSMPIFPDAYLPEMEDVDDIVLYVDGEPAEITLNATDRDNNDANIRYSVEAVSRAANAPVDVALDGNVLTLTPLSVGSHDFAVAVESNGRTVRHAVHVDVVDETSGIDRIEKGAARISTDGRLINVANCEGASIRLINAVGAVSALFMADSDSYAYRAEVPAGVYIIIGDNGLSKKIIIK